MRRPVFIALAVALVAAAVASPLAGWGETRSFAAHMAQHLLLGDLGPLALALGLGIALSRPVAAIAAPLWIATLVTWHVPVVYEAALHHGWAHTLQHVTLFGAGLALWLAVLRSRLGIPARLAVVAAMMLTGLVLSQIFLWWPHVIYSTYAHAQPPFGMSPLTDQRTGGGLMLLEGSAVALGAAGWLIFQLLRQTDASPSP